MKLESTFSVRAPIDEVWAAMLDLERVAPCLPGARVLERRGEDRYEIALEVALGAPAISYQGEVTIVEQEADARRAVLRISADGDGGDRAEGRLEVRLTGRGELTEGALAAELSDPGAAAEIDHQTLRAVAARLIDDFARNLAALLGGGRPTVNGADPASSVARMPEEVGESLLGGHGVPVGQAAPVAARAESAAADPGKVPPVHREPPPPPPPPSATAAQAGWAGATRQAGATVERLRSPLGALLLACVILGAVLGRRRRARGPAPDPGEPALVAPVAAAG